MIFVTIQSFPNIFSPKNFDWYDAKKLIGEFENLQKRHNIRKYLLNNQTKYRLAENEILV